MRPLGRPRCRWDDNIRMYFKEIGINTRNWIDSAQDRNYWKVLINAALNLRDSQAIERASYITRTEIDLNTSVSEYCNLMRCQKAHHPSQRSF